MIMEGLSEFLLRGAGQAVRRPRGDRLMRVASMIDSRSRRHRSHHLRATVEPSAHYNLCELRRGYETANACAGGSLYAEREGLTVRQAVAWAESVPGPLTLYLSD
jgi:hypothetical protein